MTEPDAALVRRMQSGDERALSEFYERWYPVVNALVSRIVNSPRDAEDVVEEAFWQMWRHCDRFRYRTRLRANVAADDCAQPFAGSTARVTPAARGVDRRNAGRGSTRDPGHDIH
jgi:hypothetical protein